MLNLSLIGAYFLLLMVPLSMIVTVAILGFYAWQLAMATRELREEPRREARPRWRERLAWRSTLAHPGHARV
jgi:hypothetical protein